MTGTPPSRVLVLRTSRFVTTAIARVRRDWPAATLCVIHQAGSEAELDEAGIPATARIQIPAGTRITVGSVLASSWGWRARQWRPDAVVLQWWNPSGRGHEAVDRAALLLQPCGFHVVLEGGECVWVSWKRRVWRPIAVAGRRLLGVTLIAAVAVLSVALWPVTLWHQGRERRRLRRAV